MQGCKMTQWWSSRFGLGRMTSYAPSAFSSPFQVRIHKQDDVSRAAQEEKTVNLNSRAALTIMDAYVEDKDALFRDVFEHLEKIERDPQVPLDDDLLRRATRSLDNSTPRELQWKVLQKGEQLLQNLQQDPRSLTRLLERDVQLIPFDELKSSISADKLEEGLRSPSFPVQILCLAYITKAADSPSGAAFVAASSSLVQLLVLTLLATDSTEVTERAAEALVALLVVDSPESRTMVAAENRFGEVHGQGLMWRRVFHDPQVYALFFQWTSLLKPSHDLKTKKGQQDVTISQARLLDFVARVAEYDWTAITTSSLPNIERQFMNAVARNQPFGGLLRYTASGMVDSKDFLMETLRRDLFMKLLVTAEEDKGRHISPRLLEAIQHETETEQVTQQTEGMHL